MYNEIKLEKGMYHLSGKSFTQALEESDPSAQYAGSPLARLDAYERQLKRFDIRVSGKDCDCVEKFFTTTESAVLFPEFIRRAVLQGMEEAILPDMIGVVTHCVSNRYQPIELTETAPYSTVAQGIALPASSILESSGVVQLQKYGRAINASYEAVRQQRLDIFAVMLRRIGTELANSMIGEVLNVMKTDAPTIHTAGSFLHYNDLMNLFVQFDSYKMRALYVSPENLALILAMLPFNHDVAPDAALHLPFGPRLYNCPQLDNETLIGADTDFAIEQILSSDVVLETDKLIDCQLDCITVSVNTGFRKIMDDALCVLKVDSL